MVAIECYLDLRHVLVSSIQQVKYFAFPMTGYVLTNSCCSFDATYLYHYTFILLCNLVFTSLPVIVLGGTLLRLIYIGTPPHTLILSFRSRH